MPFSNLSPKAHALKLAVIDGSLLIDIEDGDRLASEAFERLGSQKYAPALTPTGAQELMDIAYDGGDSDAGTALLGLKAWLRLGVKLLALEGIDHGICLETAREIIRKGGCTDEQINIALIICEAGRSMVSLVILDDSVVESLNLAVIAKVLNERDLLSPKILGRQEYLRKAQ